MSLTVLSDSNVEDLLDSLTRDDVEDLQKALRQALHEYSTGTQDSDACASQQPERLSHISPNGSTMLFMPSTSSTGVGMKVITMGKTSATDPSGGSIDASPRGSLTIMNHDGQPIGFLNAGEVTAFRTALASSLLLCRRPHLKTITVFGAGRQAFWHIRLILLLRGHTIQNINIINRKLSLRTKALIRSFLEIDLTKKDHEGWANCRFAVMSPEYGEYDRLIKEQLRAADCIIMTVPSTEPLFDHLILTSTEGRKKGRLIIAIGSYKPYMIECPPELLHQAVRPTGDHRHFHRHAPEGGVVVVDTLTGCLKEAGEIIQAKLSPRQLVELGELVMLEGQNVDSTDDSSSASTSTSDLDLEKLDLGAKSPRATARGSMASVMREGSFDSTKSSDGGGVRRSGSLSRALSSRSLRGLGSAKRSSSADSRKHEKSGGKYDAMSKWLSRGNVIYKSVGMGLMDLVVGEELVRLARLKGIGVTIRRF